MNIFQNNRHSKKTIVNFEKWPRYISIWNFNLKWIQVFISTKSTERTFFEQGGGVCLSLTRKIPLTLKWSKCHFLVCYLLISEILSKTCKLLRFLYMQNLKIYKSYAYTSLRKWTESVQNGHFVFMIEIISNRFLLISQKISKTFKLWRLYIMKNRKIYKFYYIQ